MIHPCKTPCGDPSCLTECIINKNELCNKILNLICNSNYDELSDSEILDLIYNLVSKEIK